MIKAPKLVPGDTVGIISPSWGGAGAFPHRVEAGVRQLNTLGFKVRIAPHALNQAGFVSDTAENRASDIHALFRDPEVKAIVSAIGGDHACHLLPLLDYELIRDHPKIVLGFSDMTVLNVAIWQKTGLVTFNGPALLTDFAEHPRLLDYTETYFLKTVADARPVGRIDPAEAWTEEFLDWSEKKDLDRPRTLQPSTGWVWLKPGTAEGPLIGGCLESLQHLRGTEYWPTWDGAILFLETSEETPLPPRVDSLLMDYCNMGVFAKLKGLLVGRPMGYSAAEKQALHEIILERTRAYDFPVITEMDFGHTSPQITLPIGCQARIESSSRRFDIIESGVC